jgi:hypothetical protein
MIIILGVGGGVYVVVHFLTIYGLGLNVSYKVDFTWWGVLRLLLGGVWILICILLSTNIMFEKIIAKMNWNNELHDNAMYCLTKKFVTITIIF